MQKAKDRDAWLARFDEEQKAKERAEASYFDHRYDMQQALQNEQAKNEEMAATEAAGVAARCRHSQGRWKTSCRSGWQRNVSATLRPPIGFVPR